MLITAQAIAHLLDLVYGAAVDPDKWPVALDAINRHFRGNGTGVVVQDRASGQFSFAVADLQSPREALAAYTEYYGGIDEMRDIARQYSAGTIITDEMIVNSDIVHRSECYHDFYRRWNLNRFIGFYPSNDTQCEASLIVYRDHHAPPFGTEETALVTLLAPHITRALQLHVLVHQANAPSPLEDAFDALAHGIVLLDEEGYVTWMNRRAREFVERRDGIGIDRRTITALTSEATTAIRAAIADALTPSAGVRMRHTVVPRVSGAAYRIYAAPLRTSPERAHLSASAIICITDGGARKPIDGTLLRAQYGLTPTEADLAEALARGVTLNRFATERRITIQTARSHLKQALQKTETHRQVDLVRLVLCDSVDAPLHAPEQG